MKLVETKISENAVHMRYADNPDTTKVTQWVDFQVPLADLKYVDHGIERQLGKLEDRYFVEIQLAALRYARDAIGAETQRLSGR